MVKVQVTMPLHPQEAPEAEDRVDKQQKQVAQHLRQVKVAQEAMVFVLLQT